MYKTEIQVKKERIKALDVVIRLSRRISNESENSTATIEKSFTIAFNTIYDFSLNKRSYHSKNK